jgi:ATP-dependent NAD(P)H-hydrate dehydratase
MANAKTLISKVKQIIPPLSENLHKGQAGRTMVVGGSENYTGAPYYSCMSSMLLGADMGHICCEPGASNVIKTYSPDLIVFPQMRQAVHAKKEETKEALAEGIYPLLDRMHAVVIGPGLGREQLMQDTAALLIKKIREKNLPLVIDADGLWLVKNNPELVTGYANTILTPNVIEFGRLCDAMGVSKDSGKPEEKCKELAKKMNVTIVQKGKTDYISNGSDVLTVTVEGGLKRCGGQGDVLSGTLGTMLAWRSCYHDKLWEHDNSISEGESILLAAYGACTITRFCSKTAFAEKGRGMMATDLVNSVGKAYHEIFGVEGESKL